MNVLSINQNLLHTTLMILTLLVSSTIFVQIFAVLKPASDFKEIKQRIFSWWIICALILGAVLSGGGTAICIFMFVSYLALKEFLSIIPSRRIDRRIMFWAYSAIPIQYGLIYIQWYILFLIFIPLYMFLIIPMRLISLQDTKGFLRSAGTIHWGLMITAFCLSHVAWFFTLDEEFLISTGGGAGLVLFLITLTELNDIAQFCWGKTLGKKKIIPGVSPNKTWAGFAGGVGTSMILSFLAAPYLTPLGRIESLCIGAGIAFFGFLGDTTVSAIKRDLNIKDSGSILPGHGGILDRVDSLLFTAPLFLHYIAYTCNLTL